MAERIDELQLLIGSDASSAIRQLGNLAGALDNAATSARKLSGATGFATHFTSALSKLSSINLNRTIDGLEKLSRLRLDNLKDKKISIDLQVNGADRADRIKYATEQAAKSVTKNADQIAKALGQEYKMNPKSIAEMTGMVREFVKEIKNGGDGSDVMKGISDHIAENARKSTADILGLRQQMTEFLQYVNNMHIAPGSNISSDAKSFWTSLGLERQLLKGQVGIDSIWQEDDFRKVAAGFVDLQETNPENMFWLLGEAVMQCRDALNGYVDSAEVFEQVQNSVKSALSGTAQAFQENFDKRMAQSRNAIPLDLDIDQARFEAKIQQAITQATSNKTYHAQPIQFDLDTKQLKQNIENTIASVDFGKLPQFADSFKQMSDAVSVMNQTNIKDTGIVQFTNAFRRLIDTDTSKFDIGAFRSIADTVKDLAGIGSVDKVLNNFVSSIARLANAGDNTTKTAYGLQRLTPELKKAVTTFNALDAIDATITSFIASIAKLATAGDKADKTAKGLANLTQAVVNFLNALSNAPAIDQNIANTIQGLGNLAAAGNNAGKAMNTALSGGGGGTGGHGIASSAVSTAVKGTVNSFKGLLNISLKLGGQGASALGNFLAKMHLIPSQATSIDRTALSFTNLLRAILPFYGIRGLFDWGKGAFEAGSAIVELENVIDTSFGHLRKGYEDISGYIYKWAQGTIDAFGVSQIAAERYAGRLMAMFNSSGFDVTEGMRDSAAKMTTDLIERAGDIASFYDMSVDEAMTKMQSGLAGMTRPLRSIGVNMSVANMQAYALSQGITTAWKEMDQATQMALRYRYILDATKYAEGDFGRTSMSAANQVRLLTLNFQQLSAVMGQGLISAIAPVLSWLNALIKRLIQAATAFRTFMWTLFGKPLQAARGTSDEMAGYLDDASDAAGGLADSAGGASDGLGSAGKAAKNLKKQLQVLPFDELNQLAKDTASAGSGGGGGAGGGGGVGGLGDLGLLDGLDTDFDMSGNKMVDAINKWAAKIRKAFLDKDWKSLGKNIANFINFGFGELYKILDWKNVGPKIYGFVRPFQETFNSLMEYIDWDLIGRTFGRGLNDIVYILRTWINGFNWRMYGTQIATGMNSMLDEWDAEAFGQLIADKFQAAWDFFGGWVKKFDFKLFGTKMKESVVAGFKEFKWGDAGESLAEFLNGISDSIISFLEGDDVAISVGTAFSTFVNNFLETFDADKAKEAMDSVKDAIGTALGEAILKINKEELKSDLVTLFSGLPWGFIGGLIGAKIGLDLVKSLIGAAFTKSILSSAMTSALGAGGGTAAATTAATGGATASAAAGASLTVGSIVGTTLAIAGITVGAIKLGQWLKKQGIGQLNTEGNKKNAAKTISEGQTKNNQGLASQGLNAAGYNTQLMTAPQSQTSTTTMKVTQDPSVPRALLTIEALKSNPVISKLLESIQSKEYKSNLRTDKAWGDSKAEKRVNAKTTNAYGTVHSNWDRWDSETIKKTTNAGPNNAYTTTHTNWDKWVSETIKKTANGGTNGAYRTTHTAWAKWVSETVKKTANGTETADFKQAKKDYDSMVEKWVPIHLDINIKNRIDRIMAEHNGTTQTLYRILYNASGGLFDNTTAFQVFGESGAEAAIPLERKSTMRRIANAIVDSGGMNGVGMNAGMAREIAQAVAPYIMSAVSDANNRPVQVNATLYTENNEVLARAVHQGQKSIDKRYNPVSQFSY